MVTETQTPFKQKGGNNMNTLELTQAGNIDQINRAEDGLKTASLSGEASETGENSKKTSYSLAFNVITSILLILL